VAHLLKAVIHFTARLVERKMALCVVLAAVALLAGPSSAANINRIGASAASCPLCLHPARAGAPRER